MAARFRIPAHGEAAAAEFVALLAGLEREAMRLDARFRVPGTRIRFGLDPVIGILPFVGDVIGALWSLRLVGIARRLGADRALLTRMVWHVAIDFVIGLAPVIGPLFDIFYRANLRNLDLLLAEIAARRATPLERVT